MAPSLYVAGKSQLCHFLIQLRPLIVLDSLIVRAYDHKVECEADHHYVLGKEIGDQYQFCWMMKETAEDVGTIIRIETYRSTGDINGIALRNFACEDGY